MFAIFGNIPFEVLGSPERMESKLGYDYAAHAVVEDKPLLQWVGDALQTIALELMFHASFTNPAAQLAALEAAAADHQARALVFGSGEYRGYFVVTSLGVTSRQLGPSGIAIAIQARLVLTEWAIGNQLDANAPPIPAFTPIALVAALTPAPGSAAAVLAGVSALLNNPTSTGPGGAQLTPADVPPSQIVRSSGV
ncbi:MAG TPA: phage tail protein [Candidatus Binataceae bacterium]|nr:phage tail protein [Candidatus Binataceae bacterium]